ncbi:hypothetical protein [Staphylococcus phage PMBT8]|nr:hypothetical protein [Staphylococcus phage PMBT8]
MIQKARKKPVERVVGTSTLTKKILTTIYCTL